MKFVRTATAFALASTAALAISLFASAPAQADTTWGISEKIQTFDTTWG